MITIITVVIATLNRSEAVADISLPSLLRQDFTGFNILVWDASDNDATQKVIERYAESFEERGIPLVHKRAPRRGLASQRNDAVRYTKCDVVFFIDDDCEVSSDGLRTIARHFDDLTWLKGLGLPAISKGPSIIDKYTSHPVIGFLRDLIRIFFMVRRYPYRKIENSTRHNSPSRDLPGSAEWLSGGMMAFRKHVFEEFEFDERLELFGGYAYGEDYDFSHRVFLHYNEPLLIVSPGFVVHHFAAGGRIVDKAKKAAAFFYNTAIIRMNFRKYRCYGLLPFIWQMRFALVLSMIEQGIGPVDICRGYIKYRKALKGSLAGENEPVV